MEKKKQPKKFQRPGRDEIVAAVRRGEVILPPLRWHADEPSLGRKPSVSTANDTDLELIARWGEQSARFGVICRGAESSREARKAADVAVESTRASNRLPMVVLPYLAPETLDDLLTNEVSGIDLCGNGVVIIPGRLLVYRTGTLNRFPSRRAIKNVYRGSSSVAARVFLTVPEFATVNAVREEVLRRGGRVTLGTVSKVCEALDADLVVERTRAPGEKNRRLRLIQAGKLLDRLAENYRPPKITDEFVGRYSGTPQELAECLSAWRVNEEGAVVRTGTGSVDAYAVMARESVEAYYCTDLKGVVAQLGSRVRTGERFANLRLLETRDDLPYFDTRPGLMASPVQVYLELATGDKRARETAEQVRRLILSAMSTTTHGVEVADGSPAGESA